MRRLRSKLDGAPAMPCSSQLVVHSATFASLKARPVLCEAEGRTSISAMGAVLAGMGHAAAAVCIGELVGKSLTPSRALMPRSQREDMWKALARREREVFGLTESMQLMPEDIEFIVNDVWGRRCPKTGACIGGPESLVSLAMMP